MSDQRDGGISWTDETWNPIRGCSRVSIDCGKGPSPEGCYAEAVAVRFSGPGLAYEGLTRISKKTGKASGWNGEVRMVREHLADPLRWKRPRKIFVNSMSDLFHEKLTNEQIAAVFGVMAAAPQHTFQILTKRAARMRAWFAWAEQHGAGYDLCRDDMPSGLLACAWEACSGDAWGDVEPGDHGIDSTPSREQFGSAWPLPNVWLGISAGHQAALNDFVPILLDTPAAVRWVSQEPQIDGMAYDDRWLRLSHGSEQATGRGLDWIVIGGASGPKAPPFDLAWPRETLAQCKGTRTSVWVKQIGRAPVESGWASIVDAHGIAAPRLSIEEATRLAPEYVRGHVVTPRPMKLRDRHGADMMEWPGDLRVRQFPGGAT